MKNLLSILLLSAISLSGTAQTGYNMSGPYSTIARDGEFRGSKNGSERDMKTAWDFAEAGKHEEAVHIINAYAGRLQRLDGHDAPLCLIQGYWLCRAMMLEKEYQTEEWEKMLRRAMIPTMEQFERDSPYANGNWGAIVNRFRMAAAIVMNDTVMYRQAVDYYLHGYDNGSLPRYIGETGQCQETGRDQGHVQLGLQAMADICEMAWQQGDDLWGALDNRLLKGFEYAARYNLGHKVPFKTWTDCTGLYCDWTTPGDMGRGKVWDIYREPYKHYVDKKGLRMPYTKKVLDFQAKAEAMGKSREMNVPGVSERAGMHQAFTYTAPENAPLKTDYDVFIRPRGQNEWTKIDTYMAKVNAPSENNRHKVSEISYSFFDFTGNVFVRVVSKKKKFRNARIRPDYRGVIANIQNDSTVQFLLFQPENVSIEFDGNVTDNLLLFTSKPPVAVKEAEKQAKKEKRTFIYYAPGLYTQDTVRLASNTTVYLAGGSYFTGTFAIEDAENVTILGRGVARPPKGYEGCHIHRSKNVLVEGLILNTCPVGGSDGVVLRDVRSISHPGWGDGLNVFASSNVLYDRVFCRNSDDCTTAYATRKGFSGNTRNIHMRNSTLWADVAHPIFIGIHGNPEVGDTIEHLVYENIDILGQHEPQVDYQGCLAVNCGDGNIVRDVLFDNIRIEQIACGSITQIKVGFNQKYCTAPGKGVEDIVFRNVRYTGVQPNLSIINGYDTERRVRNVTFEGLKINGQTIHDEMEDKPRWYATADCVPMYVGNHAEGVTFNKDIGPVGVNSQLAYCSSQVYRALESLRPHGFTMMPRNILKNEQTWNLREARSEEWCSGFWPGILWMNYSHTRSKAVMKAAKAYTDAVIPIINSPVYDHDLGFIAIGSLLKGYEQTKDTRYRQLALQAADSLATLYNEKAGTLLSWPRHIKQYGGHNTIMDNMMNLELLYWAAEEMKSDRAKSNRLRDIATRHAETTMQNHFRQDGSCYHVAVYDTLDGHFLRGVTHQGYSDRSMWSRGQSWAIYGYTMVYRYTKDKCFLYFAQKVADIYLKRLKETSEDMVPIWDMDDPRGTAAPKDASAACIAASALLELDRYSDNDRYKKAAEEMLRDLSTDRYQSRSRNVAFLMHSTGHHPAGSEIDAGIVYADYYYLEALLRLEQTCL
ncbi:glycoside hydrolase family 88 protein [Xylanibacter muris]|uniref:Endopolygalacturonase n=1 Tax=Xylanibacter muris TaxID=2736290 RepID=A0ABX2AIZ8_9BACT|nr:glycoside hydrolase family 88 protein [Xylanibacter muris]NPD91011.1 endopolygalacturonase [Xylanibacter muris]